MTEVEQTLLVSGMAKYVAIIERWEKFDGVVTFCGIESYYEIKIQSC